MSRKDLIKSIISTIENGIFVEIGTHNGEFSDFILSNSTNSTLYCIDPYIKYDDYQDGINDITGDDLFNSVQNNLKQKFGDRVIFIRNFSKDAADLIPNDIDFLYIDGNHQFKYVYEDLETYYPKVKNGCCIVGDDAVDNNDSNRNLNGDIYIEWIPGCYGHYGVVKAFREFIQNKNITGEIIGTQYKIQKML